MKKRNLLLAAAGLSIGLPLLAVSVWFSSVTSPVAHNASYYIEATGYDPNGMTVSLYKNGAYVNGAGGYGQVPTGIWTSDSGPATIEYYADAYDWAWGNDAWSYAYVTVNAPANSAPFGARDYNHGTVHQWGNLHASGWAADNEMGAPVTRVDILIDGNDVGDANLGGYRPDVANGYGRSDFTYSGWWFDYNVGGLSFGSHSLVLRAWDNQGASTDFGHTNFTVANVVPSITLNSPSAQQITLNTALTISSTATDGDGNIVYHNLDIQRPDGQWNWQGGWAVGEPYTGGPVGSAANSTRSASFTFNQLGTWYVRSWVADAGGNSLHSQTVAITVIQPNNPPSVAWHTLPPASPYSGTNFTARATGSDGDGNLAAVQVDIQVNGGSWTAFAYNNGGNGYSNTSDANVVTAGGVGTTYRFRARAVDTNLAYSNGGSDIYSDVVTVPKLNQSPPSVTSAASFTYGNAYTATASGGAGSGAYEWSLGSGSTASGAAIHASSGAVTANSSGTVVIRVRRLGDASYNDSPWSADFTVTVGQRPITVTLAGSKTYDGALSATGASASITSGSLASGDSISYSFNNLSSPVAGSYSGITVSTVSNPAAPTTRTGSYAITYAGSFTVNPRAVTVTYGGSKTYDASTTASGASASITSGSLAAGDSIAYSYGPTSSPVAGSYSLTVTPTVTNGSAPTGRTGSYTFTYAGSYSITTRAITVTLAGSKTYTGTTAPTGASASVTSGSLASGDSIAYAFANTSSANAGTYSGLTTATVTNGSAPTARSSSYAITYAGTFAINKATLNVTADNKSKVYATANPALTHTYSGFVNGETAAVVTGTPALTTTAATGSPVGSYPITVAAGTLAATNYQFNLVNGTLTVTKATLTVTADNKTRTYGAANPAFTATYSGFVNGDTAAVLSGAPSFSTPATATSAVGNYNIVPATGTLAATNYQFSFVNGTLAVTKATLTVTADNKARAYGAAEPTFTVTYTGFLNGDTSAALTGAPALSTTATAASPVGTYPITAAAGTLAATNYQFNFAGGALTVNKATLNVTADNKSKVYATANPTLTHTYSGFVNGDTSAVLTGAPSLSTTAATGSPVGSYPITVGIGTLAAANYQFNPVNGSLTVTKATLTVTADNKSRTYGAANPAFTGVITGYVNGDTSAAISGAPSYSTPATATSAVGNYAIVPALGTLTAANYQFSFANGTLSVTKATLTVTAVNKTRTYGAANPALTANYTGFLNGDTSAVLTGAPALSTTAGAASPVGSYPITAGPGTLAATNYQFNLVNGTLTVTKATLTFTAENKTRPYNTANPALTYTVAGYVNGENAGSAFTGAPALSTTAVLTSSPANYPITIATGTLASASYQFSFVNGTLTVTQATQAAVTVTSAATTVYGNSYTATATGGTGTGAIQWQLGAGSTAPGAAVNSSTGAVTANGTGTVVIQARRAADTNYAASAWSANHTITVTSRAITVTITGSKVADGSTTATGAGVTVTGGSLAPGDSLSPAYGALSSAAPGAYTGFVTLNLTNAAAPTTRTASYTITWAGAYLVRPAATVPTGLRAWYRGDVVSKDGSNITTQWWDASGNGLHLTQPTAADRPLWVASGIGGQPALDFAGGDRMKTGAVNLLSGSDDLTVIVVLQPNAAQLDNASVIDHDAASQQGFSVLQDGTVDNRYALRWRNQALDSWQGGTSPVVTAGSTAQFLTFTKAGTTQTIHRFGDLQGSATVQTAMHEPTAVLTVGGSSATAGDYFVGRIAEVLVYNRALTPMERVQIEMALADRYFPGDSDNDMLPDWWEMQHFGTLANTFSGDNDGDGLSNELELLLGTDPNNPDTDGDGMPDGWEYVNGLNPLVNDAGLDPDNDGRTNLQEFLEGGNPQNPLDGQPLPSGYDAVLPTPGGQYLGVTTGTPIIVPLQP